MCRIFAAGAFQKFQNEQIRWQTVGGEQLFEYIRKIRLIEIIAGYIYRDREYAQSLPGALLQNPAGFRPDKKIHAADQPFFPETE